MLMTDQIYCAYGVRLRSSIPLPELTPADDDADVDVVIRRGTVCADRPPEAAGNKRLWAVGNQAWLAYEDGRFRISAGREVICDPLPGVGDDILRMMLLGPVMGMLLHQRGFLVLHASAIAVGPRTLALLGEKGVGKSTLAAALCRAGHTLVADDVVAVDVDAAGGPRVYGGGGQIRLWPDAAQGVGADPESLPRLYSDGDKRLMAVPAAADQARLLDRAYVLDYDNESCAIEPMPPQEAFMNLVRHTFTLPVLKGDRRGSADHFRAATRLISRLSVRACRRPRRHALLPQVVRMLEEDLAR